MRSTFKTVFYVNGSKERNGIVPIMGRVTINGTIAQFSCKLSVTKAIWDAKGNRAKGRSKEANEVNFALDNIKAQIAKHYQRLSDREAFVTAEMVRNAYQGIGTEYETLLRAFDKENAAKYDNPDKNIDDCVTYILNWVQKSGCNGFCDDEIYGQAIHYYEEKDIEVGKPLNCQVSVNHHIELTEEEKAQARQEAIRQYQQEQMNKMRNRDTAKRTSQRTETEVHQPSLFDTL
jgi:hypothetical protein